MFTPMALLRLALPFAAAVALTACGDSDNGTPDAGNGTPDAGTTDAGTTDGGSTDGGDLDGGTDGGGGAITGLANDTWTWVPFPGSSCRDGSPTGIGVNPHAGATKLMIFLQGGGACFNAATCANNPANFDQAAFDETVTDDLSRGVFDRADTANAVRDFNFVFVPYCTGDVHAGNNPAGTVAVFPGTQHFVGYTNVGLFLERIVPTFTGSTEVLLTGSSAGGFGAAANYEQVADAFPGVNVHLVDDAGPPMRQPFLATCQQQEWIDLWKLDTTFLAACGAACDTEGELFLGALRNAAATHPNARFGLVSAVADDVIRAFFGFGEANCSAFLPLSAETFEDGLLDIRTSLAANTNYGDFLFPGTDHTTLIPAFDTRSVNGVAFTTWFSDLLAGTVSNTGP